ncbi:TBC1 domain family member 22B isoform X2 [Amborella trichopoda]|uniref:TBC1 domain family member 22B isoform X2 n=1 Tax=Amborella trichopoda TaxID=13333 RepID=UPI0009BD69D8|nr:TBC1 domain family member 22B isoform X2 [Amborella trichopoda]|eukprot:XP_020531951.1 TBC1 domain family member 22B isoform X2 [Amborella trichopoda]
MKGNSGEEVSKRESSGGSSSSLNLDWRFNQTLRNVQGLLKGRSFPGKVLLTRKSEPAIESSVAERSPDIERSHSETDIGPNESIDVHEGKVQSSGNVASDAKVKKANPSSAKSDNADAEPQKSVSGARATDSARIAKFKKELSAQTVVLVFFPAFRFITSAGLEWRTALYASDCLEAFTDRRDAVLTRKRLEYVECVARYYDIPDTERSDDEINMLRQIGVDCPRTVPDVSFFQQPEVQKSLERILYTWAIRHPASGYVQGINDLATPFLLVFLSEHLEGSMENWRLSDLLPQKISDVEADCYWCLSKLLDGMHDHYTFAQPGIQRLVFKFKELVRRIDEPVSRHIEEQGLEFLQFAFRWFNCLLIREVPFHLVTRLWDTYIAEGDALPDFLVYICTSLLLTWSEKLQKLDFQEMVMFLQRLPTGKWTDQELEMVLSRAYMWHTMFESSPSHLAR